MNFKNENSPEKPVTRDEVVAAFRVFAERGVGDPVDLNENDPEVQAANALLEKWVAQEETRIANDPDATNRFNLEWTTIFLDAGFSDPQYKREVAEDFLLPNILSDFEFPVPNPERAPVSYEQALAAAKSLHDAGVKNPRDIKNPLVVAALETIGFWRAQEGILGDFDLGREGQFVHGIDSVIKAENIVKSVTLWIDAGYTSQKRLSAAIEALEYDRDYAELDGAKEDVLVVFDAALKSLEARVESSGSGKKWEHEVETEIASAIEKARSELKVGKPSSAIGIISPLILSSAMPKYKRYLKLHPDQRERITKMRDDLKAGKGMPD